MRKRVLDARVKTNEIRGNKKIFKYYNVDVEEVSGRDSVEHVDDKLREPGGGADGRMETSYHYNIVVF